MTPVETNCPSCGAAVAFTVASSAVVICPSCHAALARTDRALENLGKVAAVLPTGSALSVGTTGEHRGVGFRLVGRAQMAHAAGGVWDEWYAAFADGRWGWVAEAQGNFYLTFPSADGGALPGFQKLTLGDEAPGVGGGMAFRVVEKGRAKPVAAEGEIPWRLVPGESYLYADLAAPGARFATLDYSEKRPLLFAGEQVSLADLGIAEAGGPQRVKHVGSVSLSCPKCGGPLSLRAPDASQRVTCPHCGSLLDVDQGNLKYLKALAQKKIEPKIPLGASGRLGGTALTVVGFVQRSIRLDQRYTWEEYLLYDPEIGFRWLVDSDDHWSLVETIPPGEPVERAGSIGYGGKTFKLFQQGTARVEYVLGEFYWKVEVGELAETADYVHPPQMISREIVSDDDYGEVNYSLGTYLPRQEVERAFGLSGLPVPVTVAPNQPFPHRGIYGAWAIFAALIGALCLYSLLASPNRVVLERAISLADGPPPASAFTDPFELKANQNLAISARSAVDNSWVEVHGSLFNEKTGLLREFSLPLEYYQGWEDGEAWSEGARSRRIYLTAVPAGTYSMRLEAQFDAAKHPDAVAVEVRQGVPRAFDFLLALAAITVIPAGVGVRQFLFEKQRWEDSSLTSPDSGETS